MDQGTILRKKGLKPYKRTTIPESMATKESNIKSRCFTDKYRW